MSNSQAFEEIIRSAADKILEALASEKEKELTSWDIKIRLHLSSSTLYLALGWLCSQGKIKLSPDELIYRVKYVVPPETSPARNKAPLG